jgi:hypothetical protein
VLARAPDYQFGQAHVVSLLAAVKSNNFLRIRALSPKELAR